MATTRWVATNKWHKLTESGMPAPPPASGANPKWVGKMAASQPGASLKYTKCGDAFVGETVTTSGSAPSVALPVCTLCVPT